MEGGAILLDVVVQLGEFPVWRGLQSAGIVEVSGGGLLDTRVLRAQLNAFRSLKKLVHHSVVRVHLRSALLAPLTHDLRVDSLVESEVAVVLAFPEDVAVEKSLEQGADKQLVLCVKTDRTQTFRWRSCKLLENLQQGKVNFTRVKQVCQRRVQKHLVEPVLELFENLPKRRVLQLESQALGW